MSLIHRTVQKLLGAPRFPGRDFLIVALPKLFLPAAKGPITVRTQFGFRITVDPSTDQGMEAAIYQHGVYEQGLLRMMETVLRPGDGFLDIGANIGFMSLFAAARVGEKGKVWAFEPLPDTLAILHNNIQQNNFDCIEIKEVALGSDSGRATIYPETGNRGGTSLIRHSEEATEAVEIQVKPLNDFTDIIHNPTLRMIKIDVEGFELEVLKGGDELRNRTELPVLVFEHTAQNAQEATFPEIVRYVTSTYAYRLFKLLGSKARASRLTEIKEPAQLPAHDNLFCLTQKHIDELPPACFADQ